MKPAIVRFLVKINVAENDCWEWDGTLDPDGYAKFGLNYKMILGHRFIYEYYYGQISPDLTIDHLCRNRACVNPLHLEQVTSRENTLRGICPSAVNARKTHCKRGHPLSGINLIIENRARKCRTCINTRQRLARKSKKLVFNHVGL